MSQYSRQKSQPKLSTLALINGQIMLINGYIKINSFLNIKKLNLIKKKKF